VKRIPRILAKIIERRPWWFIVLTILLSVAAIPGITMLETESGFNTLVSPQSEVFQDNAHYEEQFGGAPIAVLLNGEVEYIFSTNNLAILDEFEQHFSEDQRYRSILSPVTVLKLAAAEASQMRQALEAEIIRAQEIAAQEAKQAAAAQGLGPAEQEQAAEQARAQVLQNFQPQLDQMQQIGEASLDNPLFVASVLYNSSGAVNPAMVSLIPDDQHALIMVMPMGNMDSEEALQATQDIEHFFSTHLMENVNIKVIADAKVIQAISNSISSNMAVLLGLSVGVMLIILLLMFRVHWRLLSLLMVGIGALWTFGLMGYASVPLSMATMAVLPVLIGLGIDYSIQFHNRYQEEVARSGSVAEAIITSVTRMLPVVGVALLATIIGFITLYISKVPMVRDFGLMLAVGSIFCYIVGLFLLHSIVYLDEKRIPIAKLRKASAKASGRIERILSRLARLAMKNPLPIFLIALIFGIAGGVMDHWLPTNTDYEQLMPQDIVELQDLRELRDVLGTGDELRFMVEANDVTEPAILNWLMAYQDEELALYPELISVSSPATLISEAAAGIIPSRQQIDQILENTLPVYVEQVISGDRKMATMSFNIKYIPLEQTHDLLQLMKQDAQPPDGVRIAPVGSLALGSSMVDAVTGTRLPMNLLCLGAVFVVLLLIYRGFIKTAFTVIPVGMLIAWASLDMYLMGIPLNPLTAVLGVLIIGIGTEFMVLLISRYDEEKRKGESPQDAMVTALSGWFWCSDSFKLRDDS